MRDSGILFSHQVNLTRKYSSYDSKSDSTDMVKLWPLPYDINTNHIVKYFKLLLGSVHVQEWSRNLKWMVEFLIRKLALRICFNLFVYTCNI